MRPQRDDGVEYVTDGTIGRKELTILGTGLGMAILVLVLPFTRFILSAMVTLFHELGHAIVAWLTGHVAVPAFDFVYGGGITPHGEFRLPIALMIFGGLAWLGYRFRRNKRTLAVLGVILAIWLVFITKEWRRELAIAAAGHAFEFILSGIFFYQALSGTGWRIPEIERPLGAFVAFFVQIHGIYFAYRLRNDIDFLEWYREGKGGALMNDLEVVALDLKIYLGIDATIESVAGWLLLFSVVPMIVGIFWHLRRTTCHRVVGSLLTSES